MLDLHAIAFERVKEDRTLELDTIRYSDLKLDGVSEGRVRMSGDAHHTMTTTRMPAGSIRVPSDEPLGLLAAALLEPEAQDSFFSWGYFPELIERSGSLDRYQHVAPAEKMISENSVLQEEFGQRLASDAAFAADDKARLQWRYTDSMSTNITAVISDELFSNGGLLAAASQQQQLFAHG